MKSSIVILITLALAVIPLYGDATEQPPPTPAEEQPEVLTRGPVNEAFAEPVNTENQEGLVAPSEPPANIDEVTPADRPTGDQFVWVPGYWAWDSDRNGYIWVSGCWRAAPPNMYWVPGYWAKIPNGWQWVSGFWSPVTNTEIEYLPAPPALADVEPPGEPPSADVIWIPPCWYWYHGDYIRRHGYWLAAQQDWVWTPSHYVWAPRGYIFVSGHWDYSLGRRGVLFAPVYFPRHFYGRHGFSYSLGVVIDTGNLEFSLFTCPRYSHYYFGDYYDDIYIGFGIFPWFECRTRHGWYDPIYMHDRWRHHRDEPRWDDHERREYDRRRADRDLRPPRTFHEMENRVGRLPEQQRRNIEIAQPMSKIITSKTTPLKFERVKAEGRQKTITQTAEIRKFGEDRNRWESQRSGRKAGQPDKERIPSAERKETAAPSVERKGPELKPSERKEAAPAPTERKGLEIKPSERKEAAPAPTERKSPAAPPEQQRPSNVSPREAEQNPPDKVKVPSPPIGGKQGGSGIFRKGPPSQPKEEQKTEEKNTGGNKDTSRDRDNRSDRGGRNKNN